MSTTTRHDTMRERAERLWPASPSMQARWLRAVELVRSTRRGWLLDQRAAKVGKV